VLFNPASELDLTEGRPPLAQSNPLAKEADTSCGSTGPERPYASATVPSWKSSTHAASVAGKLSELETTTLTLERRTLMVRQGKGE